MKVYFSKIRLFFGLSDNVHAGQSVCGKMGKTETSRGKKYGEDHDSRSFVEIILFHLALSMV